MPTLRFATRSGRPHLPTDEWFPSLSEPAGTGHDVEIGTDDEALALLREGQLTVEGRLVAASNATLLCTVRSGRIAMRCVYKPVTGERPLWDFPDGTLADREYAAYLLSESTGWRIVPPTVLRDGPFGIGMVQRWIEVQDDVDLGSLIRSDLPALRRMALFDAVTNNSDRKGGHLLPVSTGHVYGCDHGLTFHQDDKLRTVLWAWRGEPLVDEELATLEHLASALSPAGTLRATLRTHLTRREIDHTAGRTRRLLRTGVFPLPSEDWPAVPWPPF